MAPVNSLRHLYNLPSLGGNTRALVTSARDSSFAEELAAAQRVFEQSCRESAETARAKQRLREAAQEMESLFIKMMFREMKKTVPRGPILNGGQAEEIFDDLLLTEQSRLCAKGSHFGLAEAIYNQYVSIVSTTSQVPR